MFEENIQKYDGGGYIDTDDPRINKVKAHLNKYKWVYITGAVGVVLGIVLGIVLANRNQFSVQNPALINYKPTANLVQVQMVRPGPKSYVIQCEETQEVFPSIRQAANSMGLNPSDISRHLNGLSESVKGNTFIKLSEV